MPPDAVPPGSGQDAVHPASASPGPARPESLHPYSVRPRWQPPPGPPGGIAAGAGAGAGPCGGVGAGARAPVQSVEPPALPGRAPTAGEAAAITAAVLDSPLISKVPARALQVTGIRISTGAPDWAFAALRPDAPGLDPAVAVLRWDVGSGWVLDQVGTAHVGTGRLAAPTVAELTAEIPPGPSPNR